MRIQALLFAAFALALSGAPAIAQQKPQAKIFETLTGEWVAEGKAFGSDAVTHMRWESVLGGRFVRVSYRIEMKGANGPEVFEGVGHYQTTGDKTARGFWADNSGDLHPLKGALSNEAVVGHWGIAGEKQGRTEYRLDADGSVVVTDWLLGEKGWSQFNRGVFRRAPAP